jgi:hypothetical protein
VAFRIHESCEGSRRLQINRHGYTGPRRSIYIYGRVAFELASYMAISVHRAPVGPKIRNQPDFRSQCVSLALFASLTHLCRGIAASPPGVGLAWLVLARCCSGVIGSGWPGPAWPLSCHFHRKNGVKEETQTPPVGLRFWNFSAQAVLVSVWLQWART